MRAFNDRRRSAAAGASRTAILVTFALLAAACGAPSGPRELPSPRLDVEAPFRADDMEPGDTVRQVEEPAGRTSFAERLRRRTATTGQGPAEGETVDLRQVLLGGGLAAELPAGTGGWSWAGDGVVTLAVREAGDAADALLYVEPFTAATRRRPSLAAHRFQLAVDRELAAAPIHFGSELMPLAGQAAPFLPLSTGEILSALELLRTPTLGRGLGYRSQPDSFSGWRWIGSNRHGTFLRLGRTRGWWGSPLPLADEVEVLLEVLSEHAPDLGSLLWPEPAIEQQGDPAWMVLGSASRDDGSGAHLAIVCRLRPECAPVDDLARLLDSMRPQERMRAGADPAGSGSVRDLAQRHGIVLFPIWEGAGSGGLPALLEQAILQVPPLSRTAGGGRTETSGET